MEIVCFRNVIEYIINENLQSLKTFKAEWAVQTVAKIMCDRILEKKQLQILSSQLKTLHLLLTAIWGFF